MATGYTADIAKGITFQQFAMSCARAFGACVTMRENSLDMPIPDEFKPSDYHVKALAKAIEELKQIEKMTKEEAENHAKLEYERESRRIAAAIKKDQKLMGQYRAMLKEVEAWQPPTSEHVGLKNFMVSQIESSIKFDDMEGYYNEHPAILLSGTDWLEKEEASTRQDITYHHEESQKEIDRTTSSNQWIKVLKDSLQ